MDAHSAASRHPIVGEASISTRFSFAPTPDLIVIALFGTFSVFDSSVIRSAFALPSTGADLSSAS
jgi:hypothetical protein